MCIRDSLLQASANSRRSGWLVDLYCVWYGSVGALTVGLHSGTAGVAQLERLTPWRLHVIDLYLFKKENAFFFLAGAKYRGEEPRDRHEALSNR